MEQVGNYGYSTGGFTIDGLSRLKNTDGEIRTSKQVDRNAKYGNRYSQETKAEIKRLKAEGKMTVKQIAEAVGISFSACRSILFKKYNPHPRQALLTEEQIQWLIEKFPSCHTEWIAEQLHVGKSTVIRLARKYHVLKNKEYLAQIHEEWRIKAYDPEIRARNANSIRQTREREKRRILYGLPQQTKLQIGQNRKKYACKWNMISDRGYISGGKNIDIIYYDENTRRSKEREERAMTFGFEIKEHIH